MKIGFTKDKEKERIASRTWELHKTSSLVEAVHKAKDMGWEQDLVQVRYEQNDAGETYYVEPFEKGCGCRGILKYDNYFNRTN